MKKVIVYCIAFLLVFCGLANELGNLLREKAIKDGKEIKIGGSCPNEEKVHCGIDVILAGAPTDCEEWYLGDAPMDIQEVANDVGAYSRWVEYPSRRFFQSSLWIIVSADTGWERKQENDEGCGTFCPDGVLKICNFPIIINKGNVFTVASGVYSETVVSNPKGGCTKIGFDKDKPCPGSGK